ncbi:MAG: capsule assembly Wzi family protein [Bacteroidetes bacterium]|nr:capsule assembly Wzi family protein [Bacteroidota bacterium]
MIKSSAHIISGICFLLISAFAQAQYNGFLQKNDLADGLRTIQILDSAAAAKQNLTDYSFTIRPIMPEIWESTKKNWIAFKRIGYSRSFNDSVPLTINNESFYSATGWQERITAGVQLKLGRLLVDFQPEYVKAENLKQASISDQVRDGNYFTRLYFYQLNVIDWPQQFGTKPLEKFYLGQSSAKILFDHFSVGLSNENIWWGPGRRNALVMTNNAPGFLHADVKTAKPVKTIFGSIEMQAVFGKLDSSGVEPVENLRQQQYWPGAYIPKENIRRQLLGFVFSWKPRWIKHLHIGYAAAYYGYETYENATGDPIPLYPYSMTIPKGKGAKMGSLFFRYAMPEDGAEIYGEFGRADRLPTPWNLTEDTIPVGYVFGLRKWMKLRGQNHIEVSMELSHLQLPDPRLTFNAVSPFGIPKVSSWYTHPQVRQGYTNHGQLLGAGIGPGGNSQFLGISWINGQNRIGVHGERWVHNNEMNYYQNLSSALGYGPHFKYWASFTYGAHAQVRVKNLFLSAAYNVGKSLNYQWVKIGGGNDGPSISDKPVSNFSFSVQYELPRNLEFHWPKTGINQKLKKFGDKIGWPFCNCKFGFKQKESVTPE